MSLLNSLKYIEIINNTTRKIEKNEIKLNNLNVFPVADGDTGTNVLLTLLDGKKVINNIPSHSLKEITSNYARRLLLGSRGNSGVMLAQFFRGFDEGVKNSTDVLSVQDLLQCFKCGYKYTYSSVNNPQEGTILTVMRTVCEQDYSNLNSVTMDIVIKKMYTAACKSLIDGINILAILKETGVVDSGGYAFLLFIEELYISLSTEPIDKKISCIKYWQDKIAPFTPEYSSKFKRWKDDLSGHKYKDSADVHKVETLEYNFCTEFFMESNTDVDTVKKQLQKYGDYITVAQVDRNYKIHIHTNEPGKIFNNFEARGTVSQVKIDNMYFQHYNFFNPDKRNGTRQEQEKVTGILSLVSGEGLANVMYSLGADRVMVLSDTGLPALEELITGICGINANNVVILPNDENIFPIVEKASRLSYKNNLIVKSKFIPEGIEAILSFNPELGLQENAGAMSKALNNVISCQVVGPGRIKTAADDSKLYKFEGISSTGTILSRSNSADGALIELINNLINNKISIVAVYYGKKVKEDELTRIRAQLIGKYSNVEIEFIDGRQSVPCYIVSLE